MIDQSLPAGVVRDTMEVDVLIVGGGSAGLSCALKLAQLTEGKNLNIVVLEKGSEVGAHSLSGAVLKPTSLKELVPDFKEKGCPIETEVVEDAVHYLTAKSSFKFPLVPPPFVNHGNFVVSISKFNRWLAQQCESKGINIFPGFAAVEVLYDGNKVIGVQTGDKGRDKNGVPKANFEPGMLIKAQLTVFAEGTRGSLFKKLDKKFNLRDGKNPEVFEEGVKEVIQMPAGTVKPGQVIHTMGFPLKKSIGGTFIYTIPGDKILLGLVAFLDSKDPMLDPHRELQILKTHPFVNQLIKGGKVIAYGGKTLPAGGWYSMPKLFGDGWLVVGDSASMVDVQKLKGIHLAMKSGMLAAETAAEALNANDFTEKTLSNYESKVHSSFVKKELYRVRNFHQALSKGFFASLPSIALQEMTGGRGLIDFLKIEKKDSAETHEFDQVWAEKTSEDSCFKVPKPDGQLFFDKLSSVYLTGTGHDEDSPNHLILRNGDICRSECYPKMRSPCVQFCPASVYEMIPAKNGNSDQKDLQINFTNCIHCKTCDIKCPHENIDWTTPEGGGGPKYQEV
jgi:electron-transferring-flavoprotein dehydrogenase